MVKPAIWSTLLMRLGKLKTIKTTTSNTLQKNWIQKAARFEMKHKWMGCQLQRMALALKSLRSHQSPRNPKVQR
ncbi:hypothetical protein NECAME_13178 [Necator americanus]|uniref:Uncharacterized protein n=1 Tax=Necator americanus TaxID=51031 RepID=W2SWX5_NECAM|nr:hypothetical protein NECAME_13178 [Necator americanus]ETN74140.1 hypothetical protein NECAME_13178 [Necator americanus]